MPVQCLHLSLLGLTFVAVLLVLSPTSTHERVPSFSSEAASLSRPAEVNAVALSSPATTRPEAVPEPICKPGEYDVGTWRMREAGIFDNLNEMSEAYGLRPGVPVQCSPPGVGKKHWRDMSPAHVSRILRTTSWEWQPENGCRLHDFVVEGLIVRLLQAYSGMLLIGDSLTSEHFHHTYNLIGHGPIKKVGADTIVMLGDHKDTHYYLEKAGVGLERVGRPLVRKLRHDKLLGGDELRELDERPAADILHRLGRRQEEPWLADARQASDEYEARRKSVVLPGGAETSEAQYKPTIVVVNTGAHWSRTSMKVDSSEEVIRRYTDVATRAVDLMATLPGIAFFYRTTSPGHVGCATSISPNPALGNYEVKKASKAEGVVKESRYDWDTFPTLNDIWRKLYHEKGGFHLIDAWKLENQRPDAHLHPPEDCLHHCLPILAHEWTKILWHEIVENLL
ncbi:hypothetical protein MNV49_002369 [Pseudohyphozyma bogoriensis]|nr:hypothetical protein MNV49_002369 [Pseudohyphozyma bogoriensis]